MKRRLSILIALVMAISLCLSPMVASATDAPVIDGVIDTGEWDGAVVIPVASGKGTVYVIAERDYLYVLFDIVDGNNARTQYVNEVGNDQISINVNPTQGGSWGFPYDLIFETSALSGGAYLPNDGGHHQLPWNPKVNSGTLDDWATRWFPNNAQANLPDDLESATVYSGGRRITEWKIPLASIGTLPSTLKIGGAIDIGDGNSYVYPVGLNWSDASTFIDVPVPPPPSGPVRSQYAFDVFVRFGYDSTRYNSAGALASCIDVAGLYNDAQYRLEIPEGCVVTGAAGRINWLFLEDIDGDVLSFIGGDASFSEPCVLYIAEGGRLYQDYWTGAWLGGTWVEVGSFTSIVGGEAVLE